MKFSVLAFFSAAFSTSSRMRATVDCPYGLVTRTAMRPVRLTQPEMISSPACTSRGTDSPVRAAVSSWLAPETTTPSSGTRSPGLTMISSPATTSYGSTCTSCSSRSTLANSGAMSIMSAMDLRLFPTA